MTTNLSEKLPDFDDMDKMARIVADAKAKLEDAKNALDVEIAMMIGAAELAGKKPTGVYIEKVISILGNNEQDAQRLQQIRNEIVEQTRRYQEAKGLLDNMRDRIDVFQTVSANGRKVMM